MTLQRSVRGAAAGSAAAAAWAVQQPLDKRVFDSRYDDVELLGKLVTRGPAWPLPGIVLHLYGGAAFGAAYALAKPFIPGPPVLRGVAASMAENLATWPLVRAIDRYHPARGDIARLGGNRRALAQATWRHLVFGVVLGVVEQLLNDRSADEPPGVPASSNGHGDIEQVAVATAA